MSASLERRSPKATWIVVILAVGLGALATAYGGDVWHLISTKNVSLADAYPGLRSVQEGEPVRGWYRVKRWGPRENIRHGRGTWFYQRNGNLAGESHWQEGTFLRRTVWNPDGTVKEQFRLHADDSDGRFLPEAERTKTEPPWWWGVTDH